MAPETKLTYEEYKLFPNDGRRHEIVDGEHYMTPGPNIYHQQLLARLSHQLVSEVIPRRGEVLFAPTDVQLSETDIVQPDLIVILAENREILTTVKVEGPPDLVVEILSTSTKSHDQIRKKELYRWSGVPEYWIVDPDEHSLEQYVLTEDSYRLAGTHRRRFACAHLYGITIDLERIW